MERSISSPSTVSQRNKQLDLADKRDRSFCFSCFLGRFFSSRGHGSFLINVYRKPTYTGIYVLYTSHHPTSQKLSITRILYSRADNIVNKPEHKLAGFDHINQTHKTMDFLCICALAINFLLSRLNLILDLNHLIHILLSSQFYWCKEFLRLFREFCPKSTLEWFWNHIVCCHLFLPNLRIVLWSLKYVGQCVKFHVNCDVIYIGETGRSLKTIKREHFNVRSQKNLC